MSYTVGRLKSRLSKLQSCFTAVIKLSLHKAQDLKKLILDIVTRVSLSAGFASETTQ